MKISSTSETMLKSSSIVIQITEFEGELDCVANNSSVTVDKTEISNGVVTITAVAVGVSLLTITETIEGDAPNVAICTITVVDAPILTHLTEDGTGSGADTNLFGRQFIIAENQCKLYDYLEYLNGRLTTIRNLAISIQATTGVTLVADILQTSKTSKSLL